VYLAGGLETPDATRTLHTFWALDLDATPLAWTEREPWPGPERMLAVAAAHAGSFYLFSGAKLSPAPDGKAAREYLQDAWRFIPGQGWHRLPSLPRPAVAAASPAPAIDGSLAILSGDDGTQVNFAPIRDHPGFPTDTLLFDPGTQAWQQQPPLSAPSRATVPAVSWNGQIILPNGEVRPRVRTPQVLGLVRPLAPSK
jgi:N-acetylneuraminate epimerase